MVVYGASMAVPPGTKAENVGIVKDMLNEKWKKREQRKKRLIKKGIFTDM